MSKAGKPFAGVVRAGLFCALLIASHASAASVSAAESAAGARAPLSVAAQGAAVDLELVPGVYTATTTQIKVHWSPH